MGPLEAQGSKLAQDMLQRELMRAELQREQARGGKSAGPMSPNTAAWIGGLADTAGTYAGMKMRKGKEANPLVNAFAGQNPEKTGVAALAGLFGTRAAAALIGKFSPKIADALSANLGAEQMGLAGNWTEKFAGRKHAKGSTGFTRYKDAHTRWQAEQQRRGR